MPWAANLPIEPVPEDGRLIGELPIPPTAREEPPRDPRPADAAKIDWSATPQVEVLTAEQLARAQAEVEAGRWRDTLHIARLIGWLVAALALVALGYEFAQRTLNGAPTDEAIAAAGAAIGAQLLREPAAMALPLAYGGTAATVTAEWAAARRDYEFAVTLRLREALYAPADSNGAQAYLDLQRSVADAHAQFVAARLHAAHPELATPVALPPLLAITHRAGERYVVRVPVMATRGWFGWELQPDLAKVRVAPVFAGDVLTHWPAPNVIFGRPDTRETLRTLQLEARAYVLAVQRALAARHRRSLGGDRR